METVSGVASLVVGTGLVVATMLLARWAVGLQVHLRNDRTPLVRAVDSSTFCLALVAGLVFGAALLLSGVINLL